MAFTDWRPRQSTPEMARRLEDGTQNPLTGRPYTEEHQRLTRSRRDLPVSKLEVHTSFLENYHNHQVVIFSGATGSGKTTQVPQFVMWDEVPDVLRENGQVIACTQPRRMATSSVANRVAAELDVRIGQEVGYHYRGCTKFDDNTILKFMTDGMLVNQAKRDPALKMYKCIILDEAHERTASTDMLMGILKDACNLRPNDLKIVVMSATMDSHKFENYFDDTVVQQVSGITYPVETYYLAQDPIGDTEQAAADTAMYIHLTQPPGDILIFAPGVKEIDKTIMNIEDKIRSFDVNQVGHLECHALHAQVPKDEQDRIASAPPPFDENAHNTLPGRKIVVATNVAETSLTIPGIVYVIDSLLIKVKTYNPRDQYHSFEAIRASVAQAAQRRGRAGRVEPGKCFRLCTQDTFDKTCPEHTQASILHGELVKTTLDLFAMRKSPLHFDWIEPPATETLLRSFEQLHGLGLMSMEGKPTSMGGRVATLSLAPHHALTLLWAERFGCSAEIASIIAMDEVLDNGKLWRTPDSRDPHQVRRYHASQQEFRQPRGYHFTILAIFNSYSQACLAGHEYEFCQEKMLNRHLLRMAREHRDRHLVTMADAEVKLNRLSPQDPAYHRKILQALCCGYVNRVAIARTKGYHQLARSPHIEARLDKNTERPSQDLLHRTNCIVFNECTLKKGFYYLDKITAVEPEIVIASNPTYWANRAIPGTESGDVLLEATASMSGVDVARLKARGRKTGES